MTDTKTTKWAKEASKLAIALLLALLVIQRLLAIYVVPSGSMQPTYEIGDRILVNKLATPHRGDTVVFTPPAEWGVTMEGGNFLNPAVYLKRIIAQSGDHLTIQTDGTILINNQKQHEPYVNQAPSTPVDITIPDGYFFMLGDNRGNSADSRYHLDANNGLVPQDDIQGVVIATILPLNHIGK